MAALLRKAWEGYMFLFDELPDPVTKHYMFLAKPYQGLILLGFYLMFVLKWGPKWMQNRPAFKLDKILIVYNAFQVVACAYIFIASIQTAWGWKYKWICEPVDHSVNELTTKVRTICYYYYSLKLIDLLDTVFFVLRKKFSQVTFLHVYHHCGMVMLIWAAVTYYPGGHGTLVGVINSFVHVIMYSYYLLTVAVPSVKESIWLKKHITQLQIVQFFWFVVHMSAIVFKTDCGYPRWVAAVFLPQNVFMLILFIDFYIRTYIKTPKLDAQKNGSNGTIKENAKNGFKSNEVKNGLINNNEIYSDSEKVKVH